MKIYLRAIIELQYTKTYFLISLNVRIVNNLQIKMQSNYITILVPSPKIPQDDPTPTELLVIQLNRIPQ